MLLRKAWAVHVVKADPTLFCSDIKQMYRASALRLIYSKVKVRLLQSCLHT